PLSSSSSSSSSPDAPSDLPSFPTRRSSDLTKTFALLVHDPDAPTGGAGWWHWLVVNIPAGATQLRKDAGKADGSNLGCARWNVEDRKSTRLNSSHVAISYAVFCLKKKKKIW